jgi:hypothetical protein
LADASPSATARQHDSHPTRETLADAITAIQNSSKPTPSLEDLEAAMQSVEERIEARLFALGNDISSHTTKTTASLGTEINNHSTSIAEMSTDIHITYHNHLIE